MTVSIGFIGLGKMGSAMATHLINAGHNVRVFNRTLSSTEPLVKLGATAVEDVTELCDVDVLFTMVIHAEAQQQVVVRSGLLEAMGCHAQTKKTVGAFYPKPMHVSCVTVPVDFACEQAELHARHGVEYVSLPVIGRPDVAKAGRLHLLFAGAAEAKTALEPLVVPTIGVALRDCGREPEKAALMKIACNMTISSAVEAIAEGCALVEKYGIAPEMYTSMLTDSLFDCVAYRGYGDMISHRRFLPAGATMEGIGVKDTRLALQAGEQAGVPLPFASVLRDHFMEGVANGMGEWDLSAIAVLARRRAGIGGNHETGGGNGNFCESRPQM